VTIAWKGTGARKGVVRGKFERFSLAGRRGILSPEWSREGKRVNSGGGKVCTVGAGRKQRACTERTPKAERLRFGERLLHQGKKRT